MIARIEVERYVEDAPRVRIFEAMTFGTDGEELAMARLNVSDPRGTGTKRH